MLLGARRRDSGKGRSHSFPGHRVVINPQASQYFPSFPLRRFSCKQSFAVFCPAIDSTGITNHASHGITSATTKSISEGSYATTSPFKFLCKFTSYHPHSFALEHFPSPPHNRRPTSTPNSYPPHSPHISPLP